MGTAASKGKGDKAAAVKVSGPQTSVKQLKSLESVSGIEQSDSTSIIEEKERRRHKEQNEPETQIAITEAEKMLKIYRREMKSVAERKVDETEKEKPEYDDQPTAEVSDTTQFYHKPMQDVKRMAQRNKTPEHDSRGRGTPVTPNEGIDLEETKSNGMQETPINRPKTDDAQRKDEQMPETKSTINEKENAVYMYNKRAYVVSTTTHGDNNTKQENKRGVTQTISGQTEKEHRKRREQRNSQRSPQKSPTQIKEQGSVLTKTVSQHCPNLLDQRTSSKIFAPLKPLDKNSLRFEKQKVRSELENQGILAPGTYEKAVNQVIIGELEEAGILNKGQKYTLSSGSPVRRPPPRVNQLPPLNKQPASKAAEVTLVEFGTPAASIMKGNDFFFVDYGRPLVAISGNGELQRENASDSDGQGSGLKTAADSGIGTKKPVQIGDANKLKMKLFGLDTL